MSQRTTVTQDPTSCPPEFARENDAFALQVIVAGVSNGISSPTMKFFKKGSNTDLSSTYLTGSMSVSGVDTIITKTTQALKAGDWVVSVSATVDGQVQNVATIPLVVKRESDL